MGLIMGDGAEEVISYMPDNDKDAIYLRDDNCPVSSQLSPHQVDRETPAWQEFKYIDRSIMDHLNTLNRARNTSYMYHGRKK